MKLCPKLGALEDPELRYFYPTLQNRCHRAQPVEPVRLEYQSSMCLSEHYQNCPVYRGLLSGPLPDRLREPGQTAASPAPRRFLLWAGLVLVAFLGLGLNFVFPALAEAWLPEAGTQLLAVTAPSATPWPTQPAAIPATATDDRPSQASAPEVAVRLGLPAISARHAAGDQPGATAPEAAIASQASTDRETSDPALADPTQVVCGQPAGWVLYTVRSGDTLFSLAMATGSSVEAIKAANCLSSNRIITGQRLVLRSLPPAQVKPAPTPAAPTSQPETPLLDGPSRTNE